MEFDRIRFASQISSLKTKKSSLLTSLSKFFFNWNKCLDLHGEVSRNFPICINGF